MIRQTKLLCFHGLDQASLIPIIQDIQSEYRYLPPELLGYVAKTLASRKQKRTVWLHFMKTSFEPKGKYVIKVCDGTACHVREVHTNPERLYSEPGAFQGKGDDR